MEPTQLQCEVTDGVALLTLNRPEVRNALSESLRGELKAAVGRLDEDAGVRAIVLTGADPAFCSGVDLRELASPAAAQPGPLTAPLVTSRTPLIGAVNGPAYTGGLELVLACHFVIASERATFADTHARLGVVPGWGLTVLLAEAVGTRRAREMILSSQPIDAQVALRWGLVNRVVPHERLPAEALATARAIAGNDVLAVRTLSELMDGQATAARAAGWRSETAAWMGVPVPDSPR